MKRYKDKEGKAVASLTGVYTFYVYGVKCNIAICTGRQFSWSFGWGSCMNVWNMYFHYAENIRRGTHQCFALALQKDCVRNWALNSVGFLDKELCWEASQTLPTHSGCFTIALLTRKMPGFCMGSGFSSKEPVLHPVALLHRSRLWSSLSTDTHWWWPLGDTADKGMKLIVVIRAQMGH